ncbi:YfjI family protein [Simkania negevensis]|uniref:DUF3987 domain-containing protein n=1 Tax=Simkania negevensis (strain ATCC VR-1471 / DSM 27360 / Z) TaxID=331113 RepID=F8L8J1_SIMNZ|nr:YfjI family protein [Simkania negevensis]CCB89121.1 putative uncharacterized protein [Simkania negevensis Z]
MKAILPKSRNTVIDEEFLDRQNELVKLHEPKSNIPLPLKRELSPCQPYPFKALGKILGPPAKRLHEIIKAPDSICGTSLLSVGALLAQAHGDIHIDGRVHPLSLFLLSVAESGSRKSAVEKIALEPVRNYERTMFQNYEIQNEEFKNRLDMWKKRRSSILRMEGNQKEIEHELSQLGKEPEPPLLPHLLLEEPTYEGLVKLLAIGQPSIGLFSDEGGRMLGGHGMNPENELKTACGLSSLWDGRNISRIRSSDDNFNLYGRRFSTHLMMQEVVLSRVLKSNVMMEQGLFARCLTCFPNSNAGDRAYAEIDISSDETIRAYYNHVNQLLNNPFPLASDKIPNELKPCPIYLKPEAKKLWVVFHDETDSELVKDGTLYSIRRMANKAPEQALRIAGILTLIENPDANSISADTMSNAIQLVKFYMNEACRISELESINPDLELAQALLNWMKKKALKADGEKLFSLQEVYQRGGPKDIRNVATAKKILGILESHQQIIKEGQYWRVNIVPR